jgi:tetratricopeptide (TPR) repeat protein
VPATAVAGAFPPSFVGDLLHVYEATYGPGRPNVVISLDKLGNLLRGLGDLAAAKTAFARALALAEAKLGPDDTIVAVCAYKLATVLGELGERDAARDTFRRAFDIFQRALGADHPHAQIVDQSLRELG